MSVSRLALSAAALATATLSLAVGPATAGNPSTGNGAPSGSHYQLNVIGVSKDKAAEMDGNNGSRIIVPLWSKALYRTVRIFRSVYWRFLRFRNPRRPGELSPNPFH